MPSKPNVPMIQFNDGHSSPQLGFGVYQIDNDDTAEAVGHAFDAGYRLIDTATIYKNERGVGEGIRRAELPREEIFLTTKLWNDDQGHDQALRAFDASVERLGVDYVDLYLIHWPLPARDRYVDTWRALIRLRAEGRVRSIGVSNFQPAHIERLLAETGQAPAVNQIELHPDFAQYELVSFNAGHQIKSEAWSPLGQGGELLKNKVLKDMAERHGKTVAQVILRWHIQRGHMVIPKSNTPERIRQNIAVFDFALDADDMKAITGLDAGKRMGPHPDQMD